MIPKIIKKYTSQAGLEVQFFNSGTFYTEFELNHIDSENTDDSQLIIQIENFLQNLTPGITVKFKSKTHRVFSDIDVGNRRNDAIKWLGYTSHSLLISFEKEAPKLKGMISLLFQKKFKDNFLDQHFEEFLAEINVDAIRALGFNVKPSRNMISYDQCYVKQRDGCLRIDQNLLAVVKLHRLGNYESSLSDLAAIREGFLDPYEIIFTINRIDEKQSQYILNNKSKREESGNDLKSQKKYIEAQKAIEEIDNQGKKIFSIEFTLLLWGTDAEVLQQSAFECKSLLNRIGDFGIEDLGIFPGFASTLPGGRPHITNIEMTDRIPPFFPILIRGRDKLAETSNRSLLFHRQDDTIDSLDLFDAKYSNYSALVIGRSGRGKSVFTNTLQQSLLNDEKVHIILVDVKGSHTNMVKNIGGSIHKINTSNNTAISPFNFLRSNQSKDVIEIVADFLEKLLIESHEISLLRSEQALLEQALIDYIQTRPDNPSIDDFIKKDKSIPRVDSLKRWQKDGIYGSVFAQYNQPNQPTQISYFDFTNIITAQKGGIGSAVMSAIMAHFNFTLLTKKTDEKLVFIADETPFFVRSCFSSFNLLMKNVRKLNGSLVLIAQNLSDLIVDGDTSLVNQAETRIFFSKDKGVDKFSELSGLSEASVAILEGLTTYNGRFSQFLIKDSDSEKIGKLRLSREEYFRSTTHANDRDKIEKLGQLLKINDENTVIEILTDIGDRYEIATH